MDISDFKEDTRSAYRNSIIDEASKRDFQDVNSLPSNFNIEGQILLLVSQSSQKTIDITSILQILQNILGYYKNVAVSHNLDVVGKNPAFLQILIQFIQRDTEKTIRRYSFGIILSLISYSENLTLLFIKSGLYDLISQILTGNSWDDVGYYFSSKILYSIFTYKQSPIVDQFMQSPIPQRLLDLLCDFVNNRVEDNECQYVIDFFKVKNSIGKSNLDDIYSFPTELKERLIYQASYEELIVMIFDNLYKFCGNPSNESTESILKTFLKLMDFAHKRYLVPVISECTYSIALSCPFARVEIIQNGLIHFLNNFLDLINNEISWPYILKLDICILQSLQNEIKSAQNQGLQPDSSFVDQMMSSIYPRRLFNILNYIIGTCETKTNQYQESSVSQIYDCLSILFGLNAEIIVDNLEGVERNNVLTLDEFRLVLEPLKANDFNYSFILKFAGVKLILTSIITQRCLFSHFDIINFIFGQFAELIYGMIDASENDMNFLILMASTKLIEEFPTIIDKGMIDDFQNIANFLHSDQLSDLLGNSFNGDEKAINFAKKLSDSIDNVFE